jgi:5-methylcytosine-specific restriction endonuclease McrA
MNESGPAQRELPGPGTGNEVPMRAKRNDEFDYTAYLQSPEWWAKRTQAVERAGGRCQLCNSAKSLNVHHRTYARIGNEDPGDLTVLCHRCHGKHHNVLPAGPAKAKVYKNKKRAATPLSIADQDALIDRIMATPVFRTERFTSAQMARLVESTPQRVGTALKRLRGENVVSKRGKQWSRRSSLRVSALAARAEVRRRDAA